MKKLNTGALADRPMAEGAPPNLGDQLQQLLLVRLSNCLPAPIAGLSEASADDHFAAFRAAPRRSSAAFFADSLMCE